jgi:hypothetical protein
MAGYNDDQLARSGKDLGFIARFIAAQRLVDDASLFTDFIDWLEISGPAWRPTELSEPSWMRWHPSGRQRSAGRPAPSGTP